MSQLLLSLWPTLLWLSSLMNLSCPTLLHLYCPLCSEHLCHPYCSEHLSWPSLLSPHSREILSFQLCSCIIPLLLGPSCLLSSVHSAPVHHHLTLPTTSFGSCSVRFPYQEKLTLAEVDHPEAVVVQEPDGVWVVPAAEPGDALQRGAIVIQVVQDNLSWTWTKTESLIMSGIICYYIGMKNFR